MPPTILKLILVLVLCIQATLWSNSRQGTIELSTNHLVPRAEFGSQDYDILSKTVSYGVSNMVCANTSAVRTKGIPSK